jgi:hypothetical protein
MRWGFAGLPLMTAKILYYSQKSPVTRMKLKYPVRGSALPLLRIASLLTMCVSSRKFQFVWSNKRSIFLVLQELKNVPFLELTEGDKVGFP